MAARNHTLESDCIFHSDRGSQYTSAAFFDALTHRTMRRSLSRTGICFDNALAESFFAALKNERVHRMTYPTRKKAAADIANYIEVFYNRRRIHSALGYQTPHDVRTEYLNGKLAA
jgi:transposase InsO family protein